MALTSQTPARTRLAPQICTALTGSLRTMAAMAIVDTGPMELIIEDWLAPIRLTPSDIIQVGRTVQKTAIVAP